MASASDSAKLGVPPLSKTAVTPSRVNVLLPVLSVAGYWLAYAGIGLIDLPMFTTFLWRVALLLLLTVVMTIWWIANRRIGWKERLVVPAIAIASAVVATLCLHKSVLAPSVLILTGQALITAWTIWLVVTLPASAIVRQAGLIAMGIVFWFPMTQVRMEGLRGDGAADLFWRSTPTAEEKLLAALKASPREEITDKTPAVSEGGTLSPKESIKVQAGDWPEFRGPERNGIVHGVTIDTDWQAKPPKLVWRKDVGPAWSSVAIVESSLFTQEQRGPQEVIVRYDANTGEQLWEYPINDRFEEPLGGIGPRATPTFAAGKIFAQGASGWLTCLDAETRHVYWSHNIADIAGTELPVWGYSSSPLVVDGVVVTFAGDKPKSADDQQTKDPAARAKPGLLAFHIDSGDVAWHAAIGKESYSSPQLITFKDVSQEPAVDAPSQLLYLSDSQLVAFAAASGDQLWTFANPGTGRPTVQPQLVGENQLAISFTPDAGVSLLEVSRTGGKWNAIEKWASRNMKPDFSDYVHHDGFLYGFDNDIFCCISLADGRRMWKKGRYGAGQVLLLADQPLLLVITEQGELVLVEVTPARHHELAKFPAITGKTWNHPVIAHDKLYVRNAEEMACFELSPQN